MTTHRAICTASAVLILLMEAGCTGSSRSREADGHADPQDRAGDTVQVGTQERTGLTPRERAELEALFEARRDSARKRFTEADVQFMTGMIGHHAQALVMSAMAPTHGASEEVKTLAARIINAQDDEIATMQRWLRERGRRVPEIHIAGTHLMVHGAGDHAMHMPGMLTPDQMEELDQAREAEFDRLFLTYMIQHHGGAVTMVRDLFDTDGAAQGVATFKLASDIQVDQITEIARMQRMLDEMAGSGRDP